MIKRLILNELESEISQPEINILLGARQVGKTTLLRALEEKAKKKGLSVCFYDLEQPQVLAEFNRPDQEITERLRSSGRVILIDEFQYLQNASKIFKAIFDLRAKIKIYASGSSSLEIHKHLKESLAGRRFLFPIYPLQYHEIKASGSAESLPSYIRFGGMPALTQTGEEDRKKKILSEILSTYIQKDVKSLVKEENVRAFNHLLYLLAQNQGSVLSVHSLANDVQMSSKAVDRYLDILEQTYVNFRIYSYSNNLGNELKKSSKSYFYDLGIRNSILRDFSGPEDREDKGALFESFVFLRLQTLLKPNMEIKFWRTKEGDEVDFIFVIDRKPIPIEVKTNIERLEAPSGLRRFLLRYPKTRRALVVNQEQSGEIGQGQCRIRFLTFEEFAFLETRDLLN